MNRHNLNNKENHWKKKTGTAWNRKEDHYFYFLMEIYIIWSYLYSSFLSGVNNIDFHFTYHYYYLSWTVCHLLRSISLHSSLNGIRWKWRTCDGCVCPLPSAASIHSQSPPFAATRYGHSIISSAYYNFQPLISSSPGWPAVRPVQGIRILSLGKGKSFESFSIILNLGLSSP